MLPVLLKVFVWVGSSAAQEEKDEAAASGKPP